MRGQLRANRLMLRPVMSSAFEVPAVALDAEGAALVDIQVIRDPATGLITSGTVVFDVDYRFPSAVTITGLHLRNAAAGVNGPVVIDSGVNATTTAIANVTRGNIFRIAEISGANTAGLAALTGLMSDPTQFYINMQTTVNPGGVIWGQLSKNVFVFFNLMTQAEEVPPSGTVGTANSMTYVRLDRDSTGNVVSGAISFNVNYNSGTTATTVSFLPSPLRTILARAFRFGGMSAISSVRRTTTLTGSPTGPSWWPAADSQGSSPRPRSQSSIPNSTWCC